MCLVSIGLLQHLCGKQLRENNLREEVSFDSKSHRPYLVAGSIISGPVERQNIMVGGCVGIELFNS